MNRRTFLQSVATTGLGASVLAASSRLAAQSIQFDPFGIGVASGSPTVDGMVLWTRLLAPPGAVLPEAAIEVAWELARDVGFRRIVQSGTTWATPAFAHSVHVEVAGLDADYAHYWYRFRVADAISPVGRTRTLPAPTSRAPLTLALASCQNFQAGYFSAYQHMAQEPLDCVLFVGDYIYEYGASPNALRKHTGGNCVTLNDYRARYALYKSDTDLQAAHAAFPWIVTWDDHEVENDYANDRASSGRGPDFLTKRAAAYRAYWEHMPLRRAQLPQGPNAQLFRRYQWGVSANLHVLDARQYRDHQVCTPPDQGGSRTINDKTCPERVDPRLSLLGAAQEAWLRQGLQASQTHFNIIGQQSIMAQMRTITREQYDTLGSGANPAAESFWNDSWDGYPAARARALAQWGAKKNVISLGGDVHASYVSDLKADFDDAKSPVLATEIVGTSISSPSWPQAVTERVLRYNAHMKFGKSDQRGYTLLHVNGQHATATLKVIDDARRRDPRLTTVAQFVIEAGRPGAQPV